MPWSRDDLAARAAQELEQSAQLAPTDAVTLSDLGYARMRNGDVSGARVPLMRTPLVLPRSRTTR